MIAIGRKGQTEIVDGLILLMIAAVCSVVLLSISSDYGRLPSEIYEENYAHKLSQNTLLSLYHITYLDDPSSSFYRKSIMVAVSNELSSKTHPENTKLQQTGNEAGGMIEDLLDLYYSELGWHFMFALMQDNNIIDDSVISSDNDVISDSTFRQKAGNPYCSSAALTYTNTGECKPGGSAGDMCYTLFSVCTWLA
jgi:hypothetical protein